MRNLVSALKESDGLVKSVIFDGVITQRILDIAGEKELNYLIGVKIGNVVKRPQSVKYSLLKISNSLLLAELVWPAPFPTFCPSIFRAILQWGYSIA